MNHLAAAVCVGVGATLVMDAWTLARQRLLGVPAVSYGLVGRWLAHLVHGRFRHDSIAAAPRVPGEGWIGWIAHYLIGIGFAWTLLAVWGLGWLRQPTPLPALIVGIVTVVAPFFLMQPGMGAGIAASRTPKPAVARLHSLLTHTIFGLGLYAAALVTRSLT